MSGASETVVTKPYVLTCGDCAGELIRSGGTMSTEVREIAYGARCQVHPANRSDMVATNAIVPPQGWAPPAKAPVDEEVTPIVDRLRFPASMGPLTEITTRLVVAWSSADRTASDPFTVKAAALLAEQILMTTNGA